MSRILFYFITIDNNCSKIVMMNNETVMDNNNPLQIWCRISLVLTDCLMFMHFILNMQILTAQNTAVFTRVENNVVQKKRISNENALLAVIFNIFVKNFSLQNKEYILQKDICNERVMQKWKKENCYCLFVNIILDFHIISIQFSKGR